jgi:hypothetical protein
MALDERKVAHIRANRARLRAGRSETVVLVAVSEGLARYVAVAGCVWHETGAVPAGVANRAGEITRAPYDALAEFPGELVWPEGLRLVARTATPAPAAVAQAARYVVLDKRRAGLGVAAGVAGNRWMVRLRLAR